MKGVYWTNGTATYQVPWIDAEGLAVDVSGVSASYKPVGGVNTPLTPVRLSAGVYQLDIPTGASEGTVGVEMLCTSPKPLSVAWSFNVRASPAR